MKAEEKTVAFMFFSVVKQFVYSSEKNRKKKKEKKKNVKSRGTGEPISSGG